MFYTNMAPKSHLLSDAMCFFSSELGGMRLRAARFESAARQHWLQTNSLEQRGLCCSRECNRCLSTIFMI